jgi:hypothetical protein
VILKYRSGEEIRKGDRVLFHREPATVEFVASDPDDPETTRYLEEIGVGVMIREPQDPNPTFIGAESVDEYQDLEFVARAETP